MTAPSATMASDVKQLSEIAQRFGICANSVTSLPGYADDNHLLKDSSGRRFVLKLSPPDTRRDPLEAQCQMLESLSANCPDLPVPSYVRVEDGRVVAEVNRSDGVRHATMLTFLDGRHYAEFRPHTSELRHRLGEALGKMDAALADFTHPALNREIQWDLARADGTSRLTGSIADESSRGIADSIFDTFRVHVLPRLADVRQSVIHSDANDYNILVSCDKSGAPFISGILDFGDAVLSATVANPAIACAYAMLRQPDPIMAAAEVIHGYNHAFSLEENEMALLYPLIRTRLAVSVTLSARWRAAHGGADGYHTVTEREAWDLLEALESVDHDFAHYAFRDACGREPCPASRRIVESLAGGAQPIGPLLPPELPAESALVFDLSVRSTEPGPRNGTNPTAWTESLFGRMKAAGAQVGIGRYDEARTCYSADHYLDASGEPRTVHLGIDLFAPAGTPVLAPLDGTVHSFRENNRELDYGPTVVLEHQLDGGLDSFCTLYGHLSRSSLDGIARGARVRKGEELGRIGALEENGGWPPHLHFQLISDMLGLTGDFPGVAPASRRKLWTSISPDPNVIARIPESRFPTTSMTTDEISGLRHSLLAPNLSLSYNPPLHIVRGEGQYLFNSDGRAFLDCVNNVAHVGHGHPRVIGAAADQMTVLNTNTRYLHENIVRYAQRLTETLPEPLRVCFFVNSGSEANDLALRLARANTRARDIVVVGQAYHGHVTSLIDISPYKSEGPGGRGTPEFVHVLEVPDVYRQRSAGETDPEFDCVRSAVDAVRDLGRKGKRPAAFICESALSCAGQIMLPPDYLSSVSAEIRRQGGVYIADEVQVGFGRVGSHFWAFEMQGVVPDIVAMGKPIGNGHPLAAVVTTPEIAASFDNGMEYFNTFGGNPVSCAVGLAVLDVIRDERLQEHARDVGSWLMAELRRLQDRFPIIGDVRGSGFFIGIELVQDAAGTPATPQASYVVNRMKDHGVLLSTDGPYRNVIKFKPPMVFSKADGARLAGTLEQVLQEDFLNTSAGHR